VGQTAPPAPTDLHVTGATSNSITWGWTNPNPTANITVSDGTTSTPLAPNTTTFTKSPIAYGSYGCLIIGEWNASGTSWTGWVCGLTRPIAPYNPHFTGGTLSTVSFAWNNYDTLSSIAAFDGTTNRNLGQNATGYTATGILAGYYSCQLIGAWNASYTTWETAWVCGSTLPNAPTNLHTTSVSSTQVTFAWNAPDPYSWYYVYDPTGHVTGATSYTTTNIIASGGHGYACVSVAAANASGTSGYPYLCVAAY